LPNRAYPPETQTSSRELSEMGSTFLVSPTRDGVPPSARSVELPCCSAAPIGQSRRPPSDVPRSDGDTDAAPFAFPNRSPARSPTAAGSVELPSGSAHAQRSRPPSDTDAPCEEHRLAKPERATQPPECYVGRIHRSLYELRCRRSNPPLRLPAQAGWDGLETHGPLWRRCAGDTLGPEHGSTSWAQPVRARGPLRQGVGAGCGVAFVARATRLQAPGACREFLRRIGSGRLAQEAQALAGPLRGGWPFVQEIRGAFSARLQSLGRWPRRPAQGG
jgi:hypothetical protein